MSELTHYLANENNQLHRRVERLELAIAIVLGRLGARPYVTLEYLPEMVERVERELREALES
jgi:mannitol/fructose-specific phosphotransferase system IIA component